VYEDFEAGRIDEVGKVMQLRELLHERGGDEDGDDGEKDK